MFAFIRLPVPPASTTNPTSAIFGMLTSLASEAAARPLNTDDTGWRKKAHDLLATEKRMETKKTLAEIILVGTVS